MRTLISTTNSSSFSLSSKLRLSILSALVVFLGLGNVWGQTTNPTAQSLPYTQNFGTTTFTSMPAGMASWNGLHGNNISTQALAESSTPSGNATVAVQTVAVTSGGSFGFNAISTTDASFYIQTSSNSTNGVNQLATAINTGAGVTSIVVNYDLELISMQPRTFGLVLQYRLGTSGSWTTAVGSAVTFNSTPTTNVGDNDINGDVDAYSIVISGLTASTNYQIRWAVWRGTQTGSSSGIAIDNISISSNSSPAINASAATLPTFITSAISTPSTEQSFSVSGTNLTNNISITPPTGYEISLTNGGSFLATSPITLTPASGTVAATTIYTRFNPTALADQVGGNVTCSSTGATTQNIAVAGEVTNLSVGAIAFIAFQGAITDLYRIVALQDIPANTRIWFTDKAWDGNGGTLAFTTGEGNNVWTNTTGSTITAGTVIQFDAAGAATIGTGGLISGLGSDGEQLFAYQGTLTNPTFVAGYTSGTTISSGIPTASGTDTWIPATLTNGTNFVALGGTTFGSSYVTAPTHYRTLADHRTHIHTVGSLTTGNSTTVTNGSWPTYTFNFLPDEPTTQPSFSAATSVGNNQMTLNFSVGNGTSYMVVMRQGSAVGAAPTDATSYSAVSGSVDFTTATELSAGQRIVYNGTTSGTSVTVTNLSPGTTYHYAIYAYNGTGTLVNFNITSPGTGSETTTGSANSAVSDIITDGSFTEPSNIVYHSNQENTNLTAVNSVEVARFSLRDGGATIDTDANSTTLTAITFSVTNFSVLRRLALYNGATELGEVAVSSGSVSFNGLSLAATDDATQDFSLRASFAGTVTDNTQFSFTVSSATADPAGSTFAAANAGGAATSTSGDRNRIEVTATLLTFVQQPSNVSVNTAMTPAPTVSANDVLGNRDLDYTTDMAATTTGTFGSATTTTTPVTGLGTFSNLQFSAAATSRTIAVSSGTLTATVNSNTFDITSLIMPGDIAFIRYQTDAPDGFSIITFVEIPANQTFYFTDNAWTTASGPLTTNESTITWTTPSSVIPAGTVVNFSNPSLSITDVSPAGNGIVSGALNGLSATADQILMFRGSNSTTPSVFICGVSTTNWITTGATNSNTSYLPADLSLNNTAVTFSSHQDNGYYNVTQSGSIATIKALVNNGANWLRSTSVQTPPTWLFTINATTTTLTTNGTVENLSLATGETFETGANTLTINGSISGSGQIDASSGTVAFGNTSNLSLPTAFFTGAIANLSKTAGAGTLTLNDALTTVGNLSTTASTGAVILASDKQLTLTGALVNNGAMIIETGATFKQGTSVTGSGDYNVQQYLTGSNTGGVLDGRFWYMGVPLNVTRTSSFGDETTLNRAWTWSETGQAYSTLPNANVLTPTTGIVYRRGSSGTVNFNGSGASGTGLYAQDATLTGMTKTGATFSGYHLLANPYTAYLDFEMMNDVSNNMSSTIWTRAAASGNSMVFDTYNATSNEGVNPSGGTSNQYIAPMQAFWVRVAGNTGTTGNISMTRAMTSHNSTYGGLKSGAEYPAFARVNVVDGPRYDQTLVYLRDDQNNAVDAFDSEKMFASGLAQVYTMAVGKKLVMNGLKNNKKRISVPLYFDLPTSKVYELTLAEFNMENGIILLEDKQEGIIQDFTINDHYAFYASSGTLNNRFVLHFYMPEVFNPYQAPSNNWANPEPVEGGIFIGSDGRGKVLVELELPSETQPDHVQILNAAGQVVFEADLNGAQTEFDLEAATGIYLVKVTNGSTTEIKKIIIQH